MEPTATLSKQDELQEHFNAFRQKISGIHKTFTGPYGEKRLIYADWIASGRLYQPIEDKLSDEVAQYVANTHTETSYTGRIMTQAYHEARDIVKKHVNAHEDDVFLPTGTGMTGAVLKLQRMLGLKVPEQYADRLREKEENRPVVFISHMEHHSNHTSWLETLADVVVIEPDQRGLVDLNHFAELLEKYRERPFKIASITSASNVTGVFTPYREIAKMIHAAGGYCFADFAASGPYVNIDMHPEEQGAHLDAIFFSPHKFLGGPGSPGILVFNKKLYRNKVPDHPGGGTVTYTNPWGVHTYVDDIEEREDGGTPGFLQTMRAAMAIRLKEDMDVKKMHEREDYLINYMFDRMEQIPGLHILAGNIRERIGAISFFMDHVHYNLIAKLLNDHYGIQTRGGCSCAGTYGHYLLNVDPTLSEQIRQRISTGDLSEKPGWVRISVHPTMTDKEAEVICDALENIAVHSEEYLKDYQYDPHDNEFYHKTFEDRTAGIIDEWFKI